jgi:hypothetical protein
MRDPAVTNMVEQIKEHVDLINGLMKQLWEDRVEVRINYTGTDRANTPPRLDLWKATQSVDYLSSDTSECGEISE